MPRNAQDEPHPTLKSGLYLKVTSERQSHATDEGKTDLGAVETTVAHRNLREFVEDAARSLGSDLCAAVGHREAQLVVGTSRRQLDTSDIGPLHRVRKQLVEDISNLAGVAEGQTSLLKLRGAATDRLGRDHYREIDALCLGLGADRFDDLPYEHSRAVLDIGDIYLTRFDFRQVEQLID